MNLIDRIFNEPELRDRPPILVDVGAAGGVHAAWRRITRYSIGVGFEPDARESAPLAAAHRKFLHWIFCPGLAAPSLSAEKSLPFHLTAAPQCSSVLPPQPLEDWLFADQFAVVETRRFPAVTLVDALAAQKLDRIDWLKCDTQGLDLKLYLSLPEAWRARMLMAEFEPGFIDAYAGEDHVADVLLAMRAEPFWLAEFHVMRTPRARRDLLAKDFSPRGLKWLRRLASPAPGWANLSFQRDVTRQPETLDRRAWLLAWVFAAISRQHGQAVTVARGGEGRFGGELFARMTAASLTHLREDMLRNFPGLVWKRLFRGA